MTAGGSIHAGYNRAKGSEDFGEGRQASVLLHGGAPMGEMRRRGEKSKCPACGSGLDDDAYRCPKCRIYFCYKCRARVGKQEDQFQCADQSCSCYGKLLCAACTIMISHDGPVTRQKYPRVENGCLILPGIFLALIAGCLAETIGKGAAPVVVLAFVSAVMFSVMISAVVVTGILSSLTTTTTETLAVHCCCVQCRHPVKSL